jgi:hypothetical protein
MPLTAQQYCPEARPNLNAALRNGFRLIESLAFHLVAVGNFCQSSYTAELRM